MQLKLLEVTNIIKKKHSYSKPYYFSNFFKNHIVIPIIPNIIPTIIPIVKNNPFILQKLFTTFNFFLKILIKSISHFCCWESKGMMFRFILVKFNVIA